LRKLLSYDGLGIIDDWFLASERRRGHVWQKLTRGIMGRMRRDRDRFKVVMPGARSALGRIAALRQDHQCVIGPVDLSGRAHNALI